MVFWYGRQESNPQPPVPKTGALSIELHPRRQKCTPNLDDCQFFWHNFAAG